MPYHDTTGIGRPGIGDWFPKLGAWMQGNRQSIMQPIIEAGKERALGLLGTDPGALLSAGEARPGESFAASQRAGTGLLADPDDFGTQMKYAIGLMATPGYSQLGQQAASQAMMEQLGMPFKLRQEKTKAKQHQAALDLLQGQRQGTSGEFKDMAQYTLSSNAMRDDYEKLVAPFRQAGTLLNQSQELIRLKGTTGMNIVDDEQMIKSYAKILLPNEAVMTDDIQRIGRSDSVTAFVRGIANKVNLGVPLSPEERANIYEAMVRLGSESARQYTQLREDFTGRAIRSGLHVNDVLRTVYEIDTGLQKVYRGEQPPPALNREPVQPRIVDESSLGDDWETIQPAATYTPPLDTSS